MNSSDFDAQFGGIIEQIKELTSRFTDKKDKVAIVRLKNWIKKLNESVTSNSAWKRNRNQYARLLLSQLISSSDGGRLILMPPFDVAPPESALSTLSPHLLYRFSDHMSKTAKWDAASEVLHTHMTIKPDPPAPITSEPEKAPDETRDFTSELDGLLGRDVRGSLKQDPVGPPPSTASKKGREEEHALLRLRLNRLSESAERLRLKREGRVKTPSQLNKSMPNPALPPPPYALSRLMIKRAEQAKQTESQLTTAPNSKTVAPKSRVPLLVRRIDASSPSAAARLSGSSSSPPRFVHPSVHPMVATSYPAGNDKRYSSPTIRNRSWNEEEDTNKIHEEKVEDILNATLSPPLPSPPSPPAQDPSLNISHVSRLSPALKADTPPSAGSFSFSAHPPPPPAPAPAPAPAPQMTFFHTNRFSSPPPQQRNTRPPPPVISSYTYLKDQHDPSTSLPSYIENHNPEGLIQADLLSIESRVSECKQRVMGIWKLPSMCGDAFLPLQENTPEAAERQRKSKKSVSQLGRAFLQMSSFIDSTRRQVFGSHSNHATQNKANQSGRQRNNRSGSAPASSPQVNSHWKPGGRAPPSPRAQSPHRPESPLLDEPPYHRFISSSHGQIPPGLPMTSPPLSPINNNTRGRKGSLQGSPNQALRAVSAGRGGDGSRPHAVIRAIETLEGEICELTNAIVRLSMAAPAPLQLQSHKDSKHSSSRLIFLEAAEAADRDHLTNQRMVAEQEVKMEADDVKRNLVELCHKMTNTVKRAAGIQIEEKAQGSVLRHPLISPSHASLIRGRAALDRPIHPVPHPAVVRPLELSHALPVRPSSNEQQSVGRYTAQPPRGAPTFKPITIPSPLPTAYSYQDVNAPTYDRQADVTGRQIVHLLPAELRESLLRDDPTPLKPVETANLSPPTSQPTIQPLSTLHAPTQKDVPAAAPAPAPSYVKSQVEAALQALNRTLSSLAPLSLNKPLVKLPPPPAPHLVPQTNEAVRAEIAKFRDSYVKTLHAEPLSRPSNLDSKFLPTKDPVSLKLSLRDSEAFNQEIYERFRNLKNTLDIADSRDSSTHSAKVPFDGGLQERLAILHRMTSELQHKLDRSKAV